MVVDSDCRSHRRPYLLFPVQWWIIKFNIKTPGRGEDNEEALAFAAEVGGVRLDAPEKSLQSKALAIIEGLGGKENVMDLDSCMSRLRVELLDGAKANDALLKSTECSAIVRPGKNTIQIIYGLKVGEIRKAVERELKEENRVAWKYISKIYV